MRSVLDYFGLDWHLPARARKALDAQRTVLRTRAGRAVFAALALLAVATAAGLAVLWPGDEQPATQTGVIVISDAVLDAKVTSVIRGDCPVESTGTGCVRVGIRIEEGPQKGGDSFLVLPGDEAAPRVSLDDEIRVTANVQSSFGNTTVDPAAVDPSQAPYGFVDFERRGPLLWLAVLFVVLVVGLGRRVGTLSLIGVGVSMLIVTAFIVPAILDGSSPFVVALVGSFAAMFASIALVYGLGAKSLAALLGTALSLLATAVLAQLFVDAAYITGTSTEEATIVRSLGAGNVSLQGLVLAGILIGALGVLNDVTVGQAATVLALKRAAPQMTLRELYTRSVDVGRDHLGATVNTLVFAYAGAALPLLLIFSSQDIGFGEGVNREIVATEIVAALVGSIGLIAAIPLTTITAALLAGQLPREALPEGDHHGHAH